MASQKCKVLKILAVKKLKFQNLKKIADYFLQICVPGLHFCSLAASSTLLQRNLVNNFNIQLYLPEVMRVFILIF